MIANAPRAPAMLIALGLVLPIASMAEDSRPPFSPQLQREALELHQRQSQASQGLKLDAGERLELYRLQMRQRREQQRLQERQRLQLEGLGGRLPQQQILRRDRRQQLQRFGRELEQWRAQRLGQGS